MSGLRRTREDVEEDQFQIMVEDKHKQNKTYHLQEYRTIEECLIS